MKKYVFCVFDRYEVVDSSVEVVESDKENCREVLVDCINKLWGEVIVEEEYGDRIMLEGNSCGLDLDEESYLVKQIIV
jgi:hypothetical protein